MRADLLPRDFINHYILLHSGHLTKSHIFKTFHFAARAKRIGRWPGTLFNDFADLSAVATGSIRLWNQEITSTANCPG
jgi:hypothetical protein